MSVLHPIRLAIDRNDPAALARAWADAGSAARDQTEEGHTCWARILVCRRRTGLLDVVLDKGLAPNAPVVWRGRSWLPLGLALQHGRLEIALRLLEHGVSAREEDARWLTQALERVERGRPVLRSADVAGPLTDRLLHAGAEPNSDVLKKWFGLAYWGDEAWQERFGRAWDAGRRPDWPCRGTDQPDNGLEQLLGLAVRSPRPLTWGWVADYCLASPGPTPWWAVAVLKSVGYGRLDEQNQEAMIESLSAATGTSSASAWTPVVITAWRNALRNAPLRGISVATAKGSRRQGVDVLLIRLFDWAARHQAPALLLRDSALEILLKCFDQTSGALAMAIERGIDLDAPLDATSSETLRQRIQDPSLYPELWPSHGPALEMAQARRSATNLGQKWEPSTPSPGKPRL